MKNPFSFIKNSENHKLPIVTLFVLIGTVVVLLFIGYENFLGPNKQFLEKAEKKVDTDEDLLDDATTLSTTMVENTTDEDAENQSKKDSIELAEQKKEAEQEEVPGEKVNLPEGKDYSYTVQKGETFLGIANRFGLSSDQLKSLNPDLKPENIKIGVTKVKVKVKAIHIVGKGDILRVVAEKYNISKQSLMSVNHKSEDITVRGEELIIPIK